MTGIINEEIALKIMYFLDKGLKNNAIAISTPRNRAKSSLVMIEIPINKNEITIN